MKEVVFKTEPESFRRGIISIQKFLHANNLFHGTFRDGKIDGSYFSNGLLDMRRIFSIISIKGSYSLEKGTIQFKVRKSNYFYIMMTLLTVFGIVSTTSMLGSNELPPLLVIFPWSVVLLNFLIYYFGYRSREKEIIQRFEHFLGTEKDLLD